MAEEELCTWEILEGGVHRLTLRQSTRQGIDALMEHLYQIIENAPVDQVLRTFIDESQTEQMIPLNYLASSMAKIAQKYPQRPTGRTAILMKPSILQDMVRGLLRIVVRGKDRTRIFLADQAGEALAWLRRDE